MKFLSRKFLFIGKPFEYIRLYSSYAVRLQIASLAPSTLRAMAAGDASQPTLIQITHVFMFLCCVLLFGENFVPGPIF